MATYSPNFGMRLPERGASGAPDDVVDVTFDVTGNNDIVDQWISMFVCTSLTRPGNPRPSTLIFETDTGKIYRWDTGSTSWIQVNTNKGPSGNNAIATDTTDTVITGAGVTVCPVTYTFEAGRLYALTGNIFLESTTAAAVNGQAIMALNPGAAVSAVGRGFPYTNGNVFWSFTANLQNDYAVHTRLINPNDASQLTAGPGQYTVYWLVTQTGGAGTAKIEGDATFRTNFVSIRDIGTYP